MSRPTHYIARNDVPEAEYRIFYSQPRHTCTGHRTFRNAWYAWCAPEWARIVSSNIPILEGHAYRVLSVRLTPGDKFILRPGGSWVYLNYSPIAVASSLMAEEHYMGSVNAEIFKAWGFRISGRGKRIGGIKLQVEEVTTQLETCA